MCSFRHSQDTIRVNVIKHHLTDRHGVANDLAGRVSRRILEKRRTCNSSNTCIALLSRVWKVNVVGFRYWHIFSSSGQVFFSSLFSPAHVVCRHHCLSCLSRTSQCLCLLVWAQIFLALCFQWALVRCFFRRHQSVVLPSVRLGPSGPPLLSSDQLAMWFFGCSSWRSFPSGALLEANPLPDQDFPDATHCSLDVYHDYGQVLSVAVARQGSCPPLPAPSSATQDSSMPPLSKVRARPSGRCLAGRGWSSFVAMNGYCDRHSSECGLWRFARSATGFSPPDIGVDRRRAGPRTLPLCLVRSSATFGVLA